MNSLDQLELLYAKAGALNAVAAENPWAGPLSKVLRSAADQWSIERSLLEMLLCGITVSEIEAELDRQGFSGGELLDRLRELGVGPR